MITPYQAASFIAGNYREGSGEYFQVLNKYNNSPLAQIRLAEAEDVESAIASAQDAFPEMQRLSAQHRAALLQRIRDLLEARRAFFIDLIIAEAGKPRAFAATELERSLQTIEAGIREATTFSGEKVPVDLGAGRGRTAYTSRFATGPILAFSPFNFPLNLALHKIVPAFAVGTSLVMKAPPQAPLCLLHLAGLIAEAGAPIGAINILLCNNDLAAKMVQDERFSVFSFTGSSRAGWHLNSIAGKKKVLLELGGNAPLLVDETADIETAAKEAARTAFAYAGQVCISTQRIYVSKPVFEQFKEYLLAETKSIPSGDPNNQTTINGPMIDDASMQRMRSWIDEAVSEGAEILCGGNEIDSATRLFEPTILTNTRPHMKVAAEEIFGPLAILESVENFQEALVAANTTKYGLQCGVFTSNLQRMKDAFAQLQFGGVVINGSPAFRIDSMPYGGIKDSGKGREGVRYAMQEFTEMRLLVF